MAKRISERVPAPFTGCTVNREAGTIENVLICGNSSANGRDYPPTVFRRDYAKYENRPVNCDHGREATVDRRFGWFSAVHVDESGRPRGTLHALKSHPLYERVMEAAERNPALFGFSHVAECETRRDGRREVIESIVSVESIDLVAEPATTKGLFEGKTVSQISLKTFTERFGPKWGAKRWAAATKLCEDLGGLADTPVMDEPPPEADEGDLKSALVAALAPFIEEALDSGNSEKAVSALKDFVKLHAKHTGKGGEEPEPEPEEPSKESKVPKPDFATVMKEFKEAGIPEPDTADIALLLEVADPAKRASFVTERRRKLAEAKAEKPKSGTTRRTTEQNQPRQPAKDVNEFHARIFR